MSAIATNRCSGCYPRSALGVYCVLRVALIKVLCTIMWGQKWGVWRLLPQECTWCCLWLAVQCGVSVVALIMLNVYLIASSCKCLCYFWYFCVNVHLPSWGPLHVQWKQMYQREMHVYHKCLPIAHCNLHSLAWHFNNRYIWQQLEVPHTANLSAFVVKSGDCWYIPEIFFKTSDSVVFFM